MILSIFFLLQWAHWLQPSFCSFHLLSSFPGCNFSTVCPLVFKWTLSWLIRSHHWRLKLVGEVMPGLWVWSPLSYASSHHPVWSSQSLVQSFLFVHLLTSLLFIFCLAYVCVRAAGRLACLLSYLQSLEQYLAYCYCCLRAKSCSTLFATPWTAARQDPLSMGFPRQE